MTYLGGKYRFAKRLARILGRLGKGGSGRYVEPFVGGGSILAAVCAQGKFKRYEAGDTVPDLVLFYRALQVGWKPPQEMTDAQWYGLKEAAPSAMRAFAGFGCSWGGIWFSWPAHNALNSKSGQVDKCPMVYKSVMRDQPHWKKAFFKNQSYEKWVLQPGDVCYCDIPYHDSRGYEANPGETRNKTSFDTSAFWRWATEQSIRGVRIAVSEASISPSPTQEWFRVWGISRIMGRAIAFKKKADGTSVKDGGQRVVDQLLVHEKYLQLCSSDIEENLILDDEEEEEDTEAQDSPAVVPPSWVEIWPGNGTETAGANDSAPPATPVPPETCDESTVLQSNSDTEESEDTVRSRCARVLLNCCEEAQNLLEYSSAEKWHLWIMRQHDPAYAWDSLLFCPRCGGGLPGEEEIDEVVLADQLDRLPKSRQNGLDVRDDAFGELGEAALSPPASSRDGSSALVDLAASA